MRDYDSLLSRPRLLSRSLVKWDSVVEMLSGIKDVVCLIDNVLVHGVRSEEHDENYLHFYTKKP